MTNINMANIYMVKIYMAKIYMANIYIIYGTYNKTSTSKGRGASPTTNIAKLITFLKLITSTVMTFLTAILTLTGWSQYAKLKQMNAKR